MEIKGHVFLMLNKLSCNPHPSIFNVDFVSCDPNEFTLFGASIAFPFWICWDFSRHMIMLSAEKFNFFFLSVCHFFLFLSFLHRLELPSTMLNRSAESSQPRSIHGEKTSRLSLLIMMLDEVSENMPLL